MTTRSPGVDSDSASVMTYYAPAFDFPFASVEVQVGAADASRLEVDKDLVSRDYWFGNIFDPYVAWTFLNNCFQKFAFKVNLKELSALNLAQACFCVKLNNERRVLYSVILMNLDEYTKEKLWIILVETVHAAVLYPGHKAYTRDKILQEKPDTIPAELAVRLNMPLGEALVILYELSKERKNAPLG